MEDNDNERLAKKYALKGNVSGIKELVEKGFDLLPSIDKLLHQAIDGGHVDFIEYLVAQGADMASLKLNDIVRCALHGHIECVLWLVEKIETGYTAFFKAVYAFCGAENIDVVRKLIDDNKDVDLSGVTHLVAVFNDVDLINTVCDRSSELDFCRLFMPAGMGNLDVIRYLAKRYHPTPTSVWEEAIGYSARQGHVDTTLFIIDQGCNPDLALANGTDEVKAAVKTKLLYDELTAKLERSEEPTISIRKTKV